MNDELKTVWSQQIEAADYDGHMAAVGQAQANAELVAELVLQRPPLPGSKLLLAGAGTGQMFDYVSPAILAGFRVTFTDINPRFLERLTERLHSASALLYETTTDDLEQSQLHEDFALAIAVLVLEHINWRRGVASLCRLAPRVFIVMQENPPTFDQASRPLRGSMAALQGLKKSLLNREELIQEFSANHFRLSHQAERAVLDAKKMVALEFERG